MVRKIRQFFSVPQRSRNVASSWIVHIIEASSVQKFLYVTDMQIWIIIYDLVVHRIDCTFLVAFGNQKERWTVFMDLFVDDGSHGWIEQMIVFGDEKLFLWPFINQDINNVQFFFNQLKQSFLQFFDFIHLCTDLIVSISIFHDDDVGWQGVIVVPVCLQAICNYFTVFAW